MAFNVKAKLAAAGKQVDMTKAVESQAELPAAGLARLRLIAYVETGVQLPRNPAHKAADKAYAVFELSGPKHAPKTDKAGAKFPHRITVTMSLNRKGLNPKSIAYKLFNAMNYDGEATHIAELLGKPFLGTVYHETNGEGKEFATLVKDQVPSVRAPLVEDPETGEVREVKVVEPLSELKLFLWDAPDEEQWASIFIEGQYDDGKSKNRFQDEIRGAENFSGSPVEAFLAELEGSKKASPVKGRPAKPAKPAAEEPADGEGEEGDDDPLAGL